MKKLVDFLSTTSWLPNAVTTYCNIDVIAGLATGMVIGTVYDVWTQPRQFPLEIYPTLVGATTARVPYKQSLP